MATTNPLTYLLGKPRLLQDRKTVVRVASVGDASQPDARIGWTCPADGSIGSTLATIFLAITTAAPEERAK